MSDVGEIIGRLRIEEGNWYRELDRAQARADELGSSNPRIDVTANTRDALREIGRIEGAADRLDRSRTTVTVDANVARAQAKLESTARSVDSVAAAEKRLKAAQADAALEAGAASAAESRLDELRSKRSANDWKVVAAEEALDEATRRSDAAADKATRAENDLSLARGRTSSATGPVAVAEDRLRSSRSQSERATRVAALAQMRLDELRLKGGGSALQIASAEEAVRFATEKAETAAAKATIAEDRLAGAHRSAAAAAATQAAAEQSVSQATADAGDASDDTTERIALLTSAIIAVVPPLIPIAGAATGAAGALTNLGAVVVLAAAGLQRGAKNGAGAFSAWKDVIEDVTDGVYQLQDTAAIGLLPGAERTFSVLEQKMPVINRGVDEFAQRLGNMAPTALTSVMNLLERGAPLWRSGADWIGRMVQGLSDFSKSDAYKSFIDYSVANLPDVERLLAEVVETAGKLLAAWAPLGAATLPVLTSLVSGLGDLIQATGPLVPAIASVFLAFRAGAGVAVMIDGITAAMTRMGVAGRAAAGAGAGAAGAGAAGAGAGAAGGAAAGGLAARASSMVRKVAPVAALAYFLPETPGGDGLGKAIQSILPLDWKKKSAETEWAAKSKQGNSNGLFAKEDKALAAGFNAGGDKQDAAIKRFQQISAVAQASGLSVKDLAASFPRLTATMTAAANGTKTYTSEVDRTIAAMNESAASQIENAASTQAVKSSQLGAKDAIAQVGTQLKQNGHSLDENTTKGRANVSTFLGAVSSITAYGAAVAKSSGSAKQGETAMNGMVASLVKQATAAGFSKDKVTGLVASLMGIPKEAVTTIVAIDQATPKARAAAATARSFSVAKYAAVLEANGVPAGRAIAEAMAAGGRWAKQHPTGTLDANPAPAKASVKDAEHTATNFARARYEATLQGNSAPARAAATSAKRYADSYAHGRYIGVITGNNSGALAAIARARAALAGLNGKTATIYVKAVQQGGVGVSAARLKSGSNRAYGGTIGEAPNSVHSMLSGLPRHAYGTTVRGAGSAATDSVLSWLSNGEEIVSNVWRQADRNRPMLKAINTGNQDTIRRTAMEQYGSYHGPRQIIHRTVAPQIHIVNPVAVDPVDQVRESAQMLLAFADI